MNSLIWRCDLFSFDNGLHTNPQIKWTNIYAFVIDMDFFLLLVLSDALDNQWHTSGNIKKQTPKNITDVVLNGLEQQT